MTVIHTTMYKIGVTGSIGSEKTTTATSFTRIPVFDADETIKKILDRENVKKKLKKYGHSHKKRWNRQIKIKKIIFSNLYEKQTAKIIISFRERKD